MQGSTQHATHALCLPRAHHSWPHTAPPAALARPVHPESVTQRSCNGDSPGGSGSSPCRSCRCLLLVSCRLLCRHLRLLVSCRHLKLLIDPSRLLLLCRRVLMRTPVCCRPLLLAPGRPRLLLPGTRLLPAGGQRPSLLHIRLLLPEEVEQRVVGLSCRAQQPAHEGEGGWLGTAAAGAGRVKKQQAALRRRCPPALARPTTKPNRTRSRSPPPPPHTPCTLHQHLQA